MFRTNRPDNGVRTPDGLRVSPPVLTARIARCFTCGSGILDHHPTVLARTRRPGSECGVAHPGDGLRHSPISTQPVCGLILPQTCPVSFHFAPFLLGFLGRCRRHLVVAPFSSIFHRPQHSRSSFFFPFNRKATSPTLSIFKYRRFVSRWPSPRLSCSPSLRLRPPAMSPCSFRQPSPMPRS